MHHRGIALMGTLFLAFSSPVHAQDAPGGLSAQISAVNQAWETAYNVGDATTLASLYTEDAKVMAPGHAMASGRSAILSLFTELVKDGQNTSILAGETFTAGGFAVATGSWSSADANGKHRDHGSFLTIYRQVGGVWMIHRDIWNSAM